MSWRDNKPILEDSPLPSASTSSLSSQVTKPGDGNSLMKTSLIRSHMRDPRAILLDSPIQASLRQHHRKGSTDVLDQAGDISRRVCKPPTAELNSLAAAVEDLKLDTSVSEEQVVENYESKLSDDEELGILCDTAKFKFSVTDDEDYGDWESEIDQRYGIWEAQIGHQLIKKQSEVVRGSLTEISLVEKLETIRQKNASSLNSSNPSPANSPPSTLSTVSEVEKVFESTEDPGLSFVKSAQEVLSLLKIDKSRSPDSVLSPLRERLFEINDTTFAIPSENSCNYLADTSSSGQVEASNTHGDVPSLLPTSITCDVASSGEPSIIPSSVNPVSNRDLRGGTFSSANAKASTTVQSAATCILSTAGTQSKVTFEEKLQLSSESSASHSEPDEETSSGTKAKSSSTSTSTSSCLLLTAAKQMKVIPGGKLPLPSTSGGKVSLPPSSGGKLPLPSTSGAKVSLPPSFGGKLQLPSKSHVSHSDRGKESSSSTQNKASSTLQSTAPSLLSTSDKQIKVNLGGKLQLPSTSKLKLQSQCFASQIERDVNPPSSTQFKESSPSMSTVPCLLPSTASYSKVSLKGKLQLSPESSVSHSGLDDPSRPKTGSKLPLPSVKSRQHMHLYSCTPSSLGLGAKKIEGS